MKHKQSHIKKLFSLLLLICLSFQTLIASNKSKGASLTGKISNAKSGDKLVGATIYIPDVDAYGVTNKNGYYIMGNLPAGTFLVEIKYIGYATIAEQVTISGKTTKNWVLEQTAVEAEEVLITGIGKATKLQDLPTYISVIKQKDHQKITTNNIIGEITQTPGVSAITTGPNIMKPVIRGLSSTRVVTVNNGVRQEGQQWGAEHGIEIDSYTAGNIEVFRGASSLQFGPDALGGVINILPIKPSYNGHINGEIIRNFQTNNGLLAYHIDLKGNHNGFVWHLYGTSKKAHDYYNKYDGYVLNSKFKETDLGVEIGLNKAWGSSHLSFSYYNLKLGIPNGKRDSISGDFLKEIALDNKTSKNAVATSEDFKSFLPFIHRQQVQHETIALNNTFFIGPGSLKLILAYQIDQRREYGDVFSPNAPNLDLNLGTFNFNTQYSFPEKKGWNSSIGFSGKTQTNSIDGKELLIPAYTLETGGVYGIIKKTINHFTLSGGLRFDGSIKNAKGLKQTNDWYFKSFEKDFTSLSGNIGFAYQAAKTLVLKANISRGVRTPSIFELAANGVHDGTAQYIIGNKDLVPETSVGLDAGATLNTNHITASLYGYYNRINHYIYSRKLLTPSGEDSLQKSDNGVFQTFHFGQSAAVLYGMEASFDIHPSPLDWLHFKNTFSWVRGINSEGKDSTKYLPKIPAARLITELGFKFPNEGKTVRNIYLNLQMNNTFDQNYFFSAYGTETATPGYTLFNISLGTDITNENNRKLISIFISANNITDVAYQDHLSRLQYLDINNASERRGVFNIGRNFSFKAIIPLDVMLKKIKTSITS